MAHRRFARPMWHLVDAKDQLVGRIATQIAPILRGKHKPTFSPNYDCGDYVVIINAQHCKFTGSKDKQKTYSWHTGFPGGVKHTNPATLRDGKPEEVLYVCMCCLQLLLACTCTCTLKQSFGWHIIFVIISFVFAFVF